MRAKAEPQSEPVVPEFRNLNTDMVYYEPHGDSKIAREADVASLNRPEAGIPTYERDAI